VANAQKTLNVYIWGGEIPKKIIKQFEHETGITVNFSTYDSNETMIAKLRANKRPIYDVILPSAYFVERMRHQNMLSELDHTQLPNLRHLEKQFTKHDYDLNNHYSVPFIWGATGIFYNQQWIKSPPTTWASLWEKNWRHQLMFLDDARDVLAIALLRLHYSPNDIDASHLQAAFEALLALAPNIKLFASEGVQATMIDEDAIAGATWNGDAYKAHHENSAIQFVYPKEGFVIWIDCLAIPVNAPHLKEAHAFINFMLKPNIAADVAQTEGHAITNKTGKALLPLSIQKNTMIYPSEKTLSRGYIQRDVGEETLKLYNQYWQALKLSF
jgi:spermidine/putrescine transport system substrate-binding protein